MYRITSITHSSSDLSIRNLILKCDLELISDQLIHLKTNEMSRTGHKPITDSFQELRYQLKLKPNDFSKSL